MVNLERFGGPGDIQTYPRPISGHFSYNLIVFAVEVAVRKFKLSAKLVSGLGALIRATFLIAWILMESEEMLNWSLFVP